MKIMALLRANGHYITIDIDGNVTVYLNSIERNKCKKSVNYSTIINLFETDILQLWTNTERHYYDPAWRTELIKLNTELSNYTNTTGNKLSTINFEVFNKLHPELAQKIINTKPVIITKFKLNGLAADTLEEVYENAKKFEVFGPRESLEDV